MNSSGYQPPYPNPGGGGAINPAVLAAFQQTKQQQQKFPSSVSPAQLMNGGVSQQHSPMNMAMSGINPAQLMATVNPASLSQSQNHHTPIQQQQLSQQGPSAAQLANMFGVTEAQFNALPQQQKLQVMTQAREQARAKYMREQQQQQMIQQSMGPQFRQNQNQNQFRGDGGMGMGNMSSMNAMNNMGNMNNMNMNMNVGMNMGGPSQPQFREQPHPMMNNPVNNLNSGMNMNMSNGAGSMYPQAQPQEPRNATIYDRPSSSASGGMMLPPSGIPRGMNMNPGNMNPGNMNMNAMGNMNMANMGGMSNMAMGNISGGMRTPMRPPSRAMSATPVGGARGMSPSQLNPMANPMSMPPTNASPNAYPHPNQAQNQQTPSRPYSTHAPLPQTQQQQQPPQSPMHPQSPLHQLPHQPQPPRATPTPPVPGSPYPPPRGTSVGAKRKMTNEGSPSLGGTLNLAGNGRPGSSMGLNGGHQAQRQPSRESMRESLRDRDRERERESAPPPEVPPPAPAAPEPAEPEPAPAPAPPASSAPPAPGPQPPTTTAPLPAAPPPAPTPPKPAPAPAPAQPLPPLPPLNPATTHVALVPLLTSERTIPALPASAVQDVQAWMQADRAYEGAYRNMKEHMREEGERRTRGWWEKGYLGPGGEALQVAANRWRRPREPFDVRYPRKERRDRDRGRGKRREGLRVPRKLDIRDTNKPEQLVPIRLEFDVEHHKMRDTFVWNINDPVVTPESFAQTVVEDYALPQSYGAVIAKAIHEQLGDFRSHTEEGDEPPVVLHVEEDESHGVVAGRLEAEDARWWAGWRGRVGKAARGRSRSGRKGRERKRRRVGKGEGAEEGDADVEDADVDEEGGNEGEGWERSMTLDEMEVDEAKMQEEMRILIRLDIIVGSMKLDDQFEWDMENEHASPEDFAEIYAQELGLNGEFKTAIAHSIREQVQTYQKSLFLVGHPSDGTAVQDEDLRMSFLPSLTTAARPIDQVSSFTPLLNYLSDGELDRTEKDREKDMTRRRKRNTRGRRGVALPDREPIRTYRTPAIGFPELDPATLALAAAASAPMSRRAAAAAASLTIANMVASENGTAFMPQVAVPASAVAPPPVVKDKKSAKGHFKAPSFPQDVLRPRAQVGAPTPSTAADVSTLPAPLENDPPPPFVTSTVMTISSGAPDSARGSRVVTARRAKELEREAKEKEFADGQHPNMIDGVWHCSNCGCPDSIAVGRRKGPLGDKSQCGVCGKYWHRHRRPRPVEYNPDPNFHIGLKRDIEQSKVMASAKKKGAAAALRAQSATQANTPATSEPQTPSRSNGDFDVSARQSPVPDYRAISPVSTASSASEPPLAQRARTNGAVRRISSPPPPETPAPQTSPAKPDNASPSKTPLSKDISKTTAPLSPMSPIRVAEPPSYLSTAKAALMAKYPNDKFETILRKVNATSSPEWRIKCLDCPGKVLMRGRPQLYTPGPGETLSNYEVHLKNRQHRQRVNERLNNEAES
ncbi:hypothetical protein DXG01_006064 [Tephrocybe rancida]|nr:hypothetical protein DXG01_006064 [Tephrocybe rancida]